jgi:glycosyltransferase involved in cell wall biosynthesis
MFSIMIPTWNNLDYLKLCIHSIKQNSVLDHEILIHVNEGEGPDGTLEWVRSQGIRHSYARKNVGICLSVNYLAAQASHEWLLYLNDDMVCCPGWDTALINAVRQTPNNLAMFFSTLIEPTNTGNALVLVQDFGRAPGEFDEARMLTNYMMHPRADLLGQASQPTLVHRIWWQIVGGYSLEYGPGMSSDDDLLMKFWVAGCREFRIIGSSRVYHFVQKTTKRVRCNHGGRTFVMKWGITQREFKRDYLSKSGQLVGQTDRLPQATLVGKMKRLGYGLQNYPLGDLKAWDAAPGCHIVDLAASRS